MSHGREILFISRDTRLQIVDNRQDGGPKEARADARRDSQSSRKQSVLAPLSSVPTTLQGYQIKSDHLDGHLMSELLGSMKLTPGCRQLRRL